MSLSRKKCYLKVMILPPKILHGSASQIYISLSDEHENPAYGWVLLSTGYFIRLCCKIM